MTDLQKDKVSAVVFSLVDTKTISKDDFHMIKAAIEALPTTPAPKAKTA